MGPQLIKKKPWNTSVPWLFYISFRSETLFIIYRSDPCARRKRHNQANRKGLRLKHSPTGGETRCQDSIRYRPLVILHRSQHSIYPLGQAGNLARGILFVNGAFHRCFLNNRDRQLQCFLGLVPGFQLNGLKDLLYNTLHLALVGAIAKPLQLILTIPFFGGLMISQFSTPVYCIVD